MAKKEILPTDAILKAAFIYPDGYRTGTNSGKKGIHVASSTTILEARLNPKYRPAKTKVR